MKHDKKNITAMVTGMVIGAALASEAAAGIVAEPTWQKIYVDGRQVSMTAYNIAGNNLRLIDWCRGKPYTFTSDDYSQLVESDRLFARKFDENVNLNIVEMLLEHVKTK